MGENLEKQSSKIRVIKGEAPTISRRDLLKVQCGRLWRWHDGFRWFHRAGRSDIWKTLSFILALMDSIKMVSRSRTYRKTSQILHRWCRWGAGEKGLSVDALPGVLSVDDLKGKLRKPCNILCWKNWLLHIRVTLELNSILRSQELQCWGNIKYILELDSIPKNPELQCWGNWALMQPVVTVSS